jgi:Sir2- and TIR-associating SLOG family/SIR2-like domain
MSKAVGYVDWPELLRDIAEELGLTVEREHDLISLAQFHVNENKGASKLSKKILEEFSEHAESSLTHEILARLPIRTYWTTNYDPLIEEALKKGYKIPDIKHSVSQLNLTKPKRDAVVYKMHGDATVPAEAILYKEQYEKYHLTHAPFVTALSGDLISKTFLFIGFSFTDPNLDYVLSRLHTTAKRHHYCFMRRDTGLADDDEALKKYKQRRQILRVDDLKRYGIETLLIDNYDEVPKILAAIEERFLKRTVFISGSAEEFGDWTRNDAQAFIQALAYKLVTQNYRVVNGFGWGVGSAVINGALEAIYAHPQKLSEDQLVMRPFPQSAANQEALKKLWEEYRQRMIALAGVAIFIFGNKLNDGKIIDANGVIREFEIAQEKGLVVIPVGATGFAAKLVWEAMSGKPDMYKDKGLEWILPMLAELADVKAPRDQLVEKIVQIIQRLNK